MLNIDNIKRIPTFLLCLLLTCSAAACSPKIPPAKASAGSLESLLPAESKTIDRQESAEPYWFVLTAHSPYDLAYTLAHIESALQEMALTGKDTDEAIAEVKNLAYYFSGTMEDGMTVNVEVAEREGVVEVILSLYDAEAVAAIMGLDSQ